MKITNTISILAKQDGSFIIANGIKPFAVNSGDTLYNEYSEIYSILRSIVPTDRATAIITQTYHEKTLEEWLCPPLSEEEATEKALSLTDSLTNLINFFTEFSFEPNFRFVNTLAKCNTIKEATAYITRYFELIDSPYVNEVIAKTKSKEFSALIKPICETAPNVSINNRFKIYYGSQGTGKTTIAQKETDMRCIVCNSSMLPADLMEDFVFVDGKATFKPSMLWRCMEEGKGIVLDEINLLPFDSLRFLQGILDGKTEFQYKGNTVHINEGFQVIGTMNLTVNGMTYGLPEPLVDRCAEMRKFSLSAEDLAKAILA